MRVASTVGRAGGMATPTVRGTARVRALPVQAVPVQAVHVEAVHQIPPLRAEGVGDVLTVRLPRSVSSLTKPAADSMPWARASARPRRPQSGARACVESGVVRPEGGPGGVWCVLWGSPRPEAGGVPGGSPRTGRTWAF